MLLDTITMCKKYILFFLLVSKVCSGYGQQTQQEVLSLWKNMDSAKVEIQKHLPEMGFGSVLVYNGKIIKKVFNGYANRQAQWSEGHYWRYGEVYELSEIS